MPRPLVDHAPLADRLTKRLSVDAPLSHMERIHNYRTTKLINRGSTHWSCDHRWAPEYLTLLLVQPVRAGGAGLVAAAGPPRNGRLVAVRCSLSRSRGS